MLKKILSIMLIAITAFGASAEFRWGPTAGVNISNLYWKQDLIGNHTLCGPQVGILGELMIPGIGFGIDMALKYQMHGATVDFGQREVWASDGIENQKLWLHTLQLPINLRFKWTRMNGLEQYVAPFAYAGPVFQFNLAHSNCKAIEMPVGTVGIQFGIGGEFLEHIQLSAGYLWGVTYEMRTIKLDNFSARSQGWQINLAYLF